MKESKSKSQPKIPAYKEGPQELNKLHSEQQAHNDIAENHVRLGICAMSKKIQAKPMQQILKRLACKYIRIIIIDDSYWDKCEKSWPRVDALICFYSDGFPYVKAWRYVELTKPFLINDLDKQQLLWDRTIVYSELRRYNIPTPKNYFVCRNRESMSEFYRKRNSNIDEMLQKPLLTRVSPEPLERISEIEDDEEEIKKLDKAPGLLRSNRTSFYNKSGSDDKDEEEIYCMSPALKQKFADTVNHQPGLKRCSTVRQPHNPVSFLKHYFHQLVYQEFEIEQKDDSITIGTNKLKKPFVQKPFDAENHQVCIYYPERDGGGRKILFRKQKNCCSSYQPNINNIRTEGNYIYQEFLRTNGFDIKVYTVGPYYMHAQARKSPSLDGVVQRNQNGKEKRFPVFLTPEQKFIAQKVVQVFGQYVCGFDLLRSDGKSYVCDVNGWSFVKGNQKYYDDCSDILKKMIFQKFLPLHVKEISNFSEYGNFNSYIQNEYRPPEQQLEESTMQLRSIVAIFRHGDRNPKQKMKLMTTDPRFLDFFNGQAKEVKLKDPKSLTELLNITNRILSEMRNQINDVLMKLIQLKSVLEIGGHFEGLNRKVQMKPIEVETDPNDPTKKIPTKAVLILKWGGQLTKLGQTDAIELGKFFRMTKYAHDQGLISLHSSYRHDLKTYSSEQGRCLKTAAAFLKGFLNLQGDLTPIINSMINRQVKAQRLLDCSSQEEDNGQLKELQSSEKKMLTNMLNKDAHLAESMKEAVDLESLPQAMRAVIIKIGNPREKLNLLLSRIKELTSSIAEEVSLKESSYYINMQDVQSRSKLQPQCESLILVYKRWYKLQKDFYDFKKDQFNVSKIPDIFDSINYDMKHNEDILTKMYNRSNELFEVARDLAYFVVPNEYGLRSECKLEAARFIVTPLCKKIYSDLMFWKGKKCSEEEQYWKYKGEGNHNKEWRHVRTRLYFTSSSHIYSIYNFLTLGNNSEILKACDTETARHIRNAIYIGYLSHIDLRLYQNLALDSSDPKRFRLELTLCPQYSSNNAKQCKFYNFGQGGFTIEQIERFFKQVLGSDSLSEDK